MADNSTLTPRKVFSAAHRPRQKTDFAAFTSADVKRCEAFSTSCRPIFVPCPRQALARALSVPNRPLPPVAWLAPPPRGRLRLAAADEDARTCFSENPFPRTAHWGNPSPMPGRRFIVLPAVCPAPPRNTRNSFFLRSDGRQSCIYSAFPARSPLPRCIPASQAPCRRIPGGGSS